LCRLLKVVGLTVRLAADLGGLKVGDAYPVRVVGVVNVSPESFYKSSIVTGGRK
jgi:hypothetical protein